MRSLESNLMMSAVCTQPVNFIARLIFEPQNYSEVPQVRPEFNAIPGFSEIPDSDFFVPIALPEVFQPSGNEFTLEDLRTEAQSIKDF